MFFKNRVLAVESSLEHTVGKDGRLGNPGQQQIQGFSDHRVEDQDPFVVDGIGPGE